MFMNKWVFVHIIRQSVYFLVFFCVLAQVLICVLECSTLCINVRSRTPPIVTEPTAIVLPYLYISLSKMGFTLDKF